MTNPSSSPENTNLGIFEQENAMALMTLLLTLSALLAIGMCVCILALLECLFGIPNPSPAPASAAHATRLPVQFDVETLKRKARKDMLVQSA